MTTIVFLHILLMSTSLILTTGMAASALTGYRVNTVFMRASAGITASGIAFGVALLLTQPLDTKCAVLLGFVLMFTAIYAFTSKRNQVLSSEV